MSEVSRWQLRERREREEERMAEAEGLGAVEDLGRDYRYSNPRSLSWYLQARTRGAGLTFCFFLFSSFFNVFSSVISSVRIIFSWDRPGRRAIRSLQRAATARAAERKPG